ncbi:hypothetical protein KSF78_0001362 [Schistosoma japonicum]|nr:hypothetical protein KSF78_0001362 [Schistosoma japonicum]
MGCIKYFK